MYGALAAPTGSTLVGFLQAGTGTVARTALDKLLELAVTPQDFGATAANPAGHQAACDAMLASPAKVIRFTPGLYQAYINNTTSDRTFIFEAGAIIDGVVHLAIGSGPESSPPVALSIVSNIRAIGTVVSTVRVGTYYCNGVNIDKIRITDVSSSYPNQTTEGGSRGVHFYYGSKNITVGDVDTIATKPDTAAFFCDTNVYTDADHRPSDIRVGKIIVRDAGTQGVLTTNVDRFVCDSILVKSYRNYNGVQFTGSDVTVGRIDVDGTNATAAYQNVYVLNNTRADIGDIVTRNAKGRGLYISGSTNTQIRRVEASGCVDRGVFILSPAQIGSVLTYGNTSVGLEITTPASFVRVGYVEAYGNGTQGVYVNGANDVFIDDVYSHDNVGAAGYGLSLNNCTRFRNRNLKATGNVQGLRYIGVTDADFGIIDCTSNTSNDVSLSGSNTGVSFLRANYATITGGTLQGITKYRGKLVAAGYKVNPDADLSLAVGTSVVTQAFGTPLTADRTITLSTVAAQLGDRFRITRAASATGAFNLNVGAGTALKALAAGQWCDVEYNGVSWVVTASGSL
jgi:hypothetical protein